MGLRALRDYWEYEISILCRGSADTWRFICDHLVVEGFVVICSAIAGAIMSPFDYHAMVNGVILGFGSIGVMFVFAAIWNFGLTPFRMHKEASEENINLKGKLLIKLKNQDVIDQLELAYSEAAQILIKTKEEYFNKEQWVTDANNWYQKTQKIFDEEMSQSDTFDFKTTSYTIIGVPGDYEYELELFKGRMGKLRNFTSSYMRNYEKEMQQA